MKQVDRADEANPSDPQLELCDECLTELVITLARHRGQMSVTCIEP